MKCTLLVAVLTIQSSYLKNFERPVSDGVQTPDTVQWWIAPTGTWRIKTFAIDHDIHTYRIGATDPNFENVAQANTLKHYGDVIFKMQSFEFADCAVGERESKAFTDAGFKPNFQMESERYLFWNPDGGSYKTISEPTD
jgi:hypothetical protein